MGALGYKDTPILEDSGFHVHDSDRPYPPIVTPGAPTSGASTLAPSDAKVLFDGTDLSKWEGKNGPAGWKVENGYMEVVHGEGDIQTKESFGDLQLHLEFASPEVVEGDSQGRGNSGVFLMAKYEIQVLDSYDNPTYADGGVGAIYGQYPPQATSIRRPGEWNTYDIVWEAPVFKNGEVEKPAYVTVFLNSVLLHHRRKLLGETTHGDILGYTEHGPKGPIKLQAHHNPVRFRNIWLRELETLG